MAKDPAYCMTITKMLFEAEPGLLACEPNAVARASASCAEVMGSILATVLETKGEATYREVMKSLFIKADAAARSTAQYARDEIANPSPGLATKQ